jgi:hypothetical protein
MEQDKMFREVQRAADELNRYSTWQLQQRGLEQSNRSGAQLGQIQGKAQEDKIEPKRPHDDAESSPDKDTK